MCVGALGGVLAASLVERRVLREGVEAGRAGTPVGAALACAKVVEQYDV